MNGRVAVRLLLMIFLVYACYNGYGQTKNDSVFSGTSLSAIPLLDVVKGGTHATSIPGQSNLPRVFIFLSPECPLCQNYTSLLNKLELEYRGSIKVYGIIPGKTYSAAAISAFSEKYKIKFPLLIDGSLTFSRYLKAAITPEVVFLDTENELVYRGALDNWLTDLGKRRAVATESFLLDAVDRNVKRQPVIRKRTKAIGCLINDY